MAAAVAMGVSIWAMHFIAMLGFNPGAEVRYDVRLTVLSLLLAIATTAFAFFSATHRNQYRLVLGGTVMGGGICLMHYVGMQAVITQVSLRNEPVYVLLAFLVAISASTGALVVATRDRTFAQRSLAAIVLGFAIVGMHYTAMFGVRLSPNPGAPIVQSGLDSMALAIVVAGGTFLILLLALIAALSDRRFETIAAQEALRSEQRLHALITEKLAAERRVAEALAEKAQAEAALFQSQRLESLGRLTGGVAHDFNNLLTVVIGALDIILRHPENPERHRRLAEAALLAAKRGERLTAQLLAFARRQPLQPEACDLNELIRESEPLLQRAAEGVSLVFDLATARNVALIDPAQFEAMLLNLVVNAVDANAQRITLASTRCEAPAEFAELAPGRYLRLCVSDDGDGMSPEVMTHVFEPFYTTKGQGKGTGLGLSQAYGFVRQSGGEVRVESEPGRGTRFTLYLPLMQAATVELVEKPVVAPHPARHLEVLLAEDDASVAAITDTMLRDLGHEVTRVENAEQALQILRSDKQIDLLLSDVVMPGGMNGVELAQQAVILRPGLRVLLSSGYAGESIDTVLMQGHWPFLRKPYLEDELAAQLHTLSAATA
ncbi:MAG TPA: MHYT domain-containing protein [Povalibacter sp.]|nr:MHYT domain-containing protein [Povalibacter sp.]